MTTAGPTAYPPSWRPPGSPPPDTNPNTEALAMAIDAYVASLSDEEFAALVARTRNGGQQTQRQQYGQ